MLFLLSFFGHCTPCIGVNEPSSSSNLMTSQNELECTCSGDCKYTSDTRHITLDLFVYYNSFPSPFPTHQAYLPCTTNQNEQTCTLQITDSVYYMYSSFQFHLSSISEQLRTKPVSADNASQSVSYRRPLSQELTSSCK